MRLYPPATLLLCNIMAWGGFEALSQERMNVLFIISDDLNTEIGPYNGISEHTPHLSRLAEEGIQFSRTYCQYPLCGPSRASLMSGLYPETNGVLTNQHVTGSYRGSNPDLSQHPTMAGFFREQGYFTARVSKIFHMGVPGGIERADPGDDDPESWDYAYNVMGPETLSRGDFELLSPGNTHYGSAFANIVLKDGSETTQTDYLATSQAIAIMESRAASVAPKARNLVKLKPDAPFFLAVGLVRPHVPFVAPENCFLPYPYEDMVLPETVFSDDVPDPALRNRNHNIWKMDEDQQKKTISGYLASVRFMDQQVGRLLNTLDSLNLRQNTIVVFISDHGYNLCEHDCWGKVSLWEGSIRVPMIISHPGYAEFHGKTYESITELIDIYPTLAELNGYTSQQPEILQGRSLAALITTGNTKESDKDRAAYTISYNGNATSIRTQRWRYNLWGSPSEPQGEELYDHQNDPEEHFNLANNPDYGEILQEMRERMSRIQDSVQNR